MEENWKKMHSIHGNLYEFLGVKENCTQKEIKRSNRKMAYILHPDRNKDSNAGNSSLSKIS